MKNNNNNMELEIRKIKENKTLKELLEFGIINIDKPSGPTSFNVSDSVRKMLKEIGLNKTSHFGTLDPKVTGVLPIALNRACKLTGFFIGHDKEYIGIMRLHDNVPIEKISQTINEHFIGKIKQTPPKKSSVKRQEREREVKKFEILEKGGKDFLFKSEVQGGTYIRKLISDLGEKLNIGAHMLELRRIRAGIFSEEDANYPSIKLYELEKAIQEYKKGDESHLKKIIIPAEIISTIYPVVYIKENNLKQIFTGKPIYESDVLKDILNKEKLEENELICIFCEDKFVEIARVNNQMINGKKIFAKPEFVLQPILKK